MENPATVPNEPGPEQLAWIWSYANSSGEKPALKVDEIIRITNGLGILEQPLAFWILSYQAEFLPETLRDYLEKSKSLKDIVAAAIADGEKNRQRKSENSRSLPWFPIYAYRNGYAKDERTYEE